MIATVRHQGLVYGEQVCSVLSIDKFIYKRRKRMVSLGKSLCDYKREKITLSVKYNNRNYHVLLYLFWRAGGILLQYRAVQCYNN